jgi:hypothetical protein
MSDCIIKHCNKYKEKFTKKFYIQTIELGKIYKSFKTIQDIETFYKRFEKGVKEQSYYKQLQICKKKNCNLIELNNQINLYKDAIKVLLINNERYFIKYPFWNDLKINISKLLNKSTITDNERIKISFYSLLLAHLL